VSVSTGFPHWFPFDSSFWSSVLSSVLGVRSRRLLLIFFWLEAFGFPRVLLVRLDFLRRSVYPSALRSPLCATARANGPSSDAILSPVIIHRISIVTASWFLLV
jgi:hypothetical protein